MWHPVLCIVVAILTIHECVNVNVANGCVKPAEPLNCQLTSYCELYTSATGYVGQTTLQNITQNQYNATCEDDINPMFFAQGAGLQMRFLNQESSIMLVYFPQIKMSSMWFQYKCISEGVSAVKINNDWIPITQAKCVIGSGFPQIEKDAGQSCVAIY